MISSRAISKTLRPVFIFLALGVWFFALFPGSYASGTSESQGPGVELIPDALIELGSDDGPSYALFVEKATQHVLVYESKDRDAFRLRHQFICSTGRVPGNKQASGDRRTPEGVYFFTGAYEKRELQPIYGSRAFVMDYPNLLDRKFQRDGNNIWLHGSNKPIKPRDSKGCVALNNDDLETLAPHVLLNRTPIIIKQKLHMVRPDKRRTDQKNLADFLEIWKTALVTGDSAKYRACYSEHFRELNPLWEQWGPIRTAWQRAQLPFDVTLENLTLLRGNPCVVALFDEVMHLDRHETIVGTKKLFLEEHGAAWKIMREVYQPAESNPSISKPWRTALVDLDRLYRDYGAISDRVAEWAEAWSSEDIPRYRACYAEDFRANNMDLGAWIRYKEGLNRRYDFIRVSVESLKIHQGPERSTAVFLQRYRSSGYHAVGIKHLYLKRIGGAWKIYRETWRRSQQ
jgi:murein L,D-transpeptidase YafK